MKQAVHFTFAAEILKRLGEELNPNPDQGILELVKNSYDADALNCNVEVNLLNGRTVVISDDGCGMNADTIRDAWLLIGKSSKTIKEVSRLGRKPAGNKGLGRLAALRMGRYVSLTTRPFNEPKIEYSLSIDWSLFDKVKTVDEVDLVIEARARSKNQSHGTTIIIEEIKNPLSEGEIRRLARGLLLLADPFGDNPIGFKPQLIAPEFEELEELVNQRYFNDCEYHLIAEVDENGWASAVVTDHQENILYEASHQDLRPRQTQEPYECPVAKFDLWAFLLGGSRFTPRLATIPELKEWLKTFGGVHLYIRGLRVSPYGDPGNDWLDMNLLRSIHPEYRPSTNNSIGRIYLDDEEEIFLQKTDRSGILENMAFADLRQFAIDAIKWMSNRRVAERDNRVKNLKESLSAEVRPARENIVNMIIKELPNSKQKEAEQVFKNYEKVRDREADLLRKELQLYRLLGTAGITAAVFAHETKDTSTLISRNLRAIQRKWKSYSKEDIPNDVLNNFEIVFNIAKSLKAFGTLTLNFVNRKKRRQEKVEIHNVVENVIKLYKPLAVENSVDIYTNFADGKPYLRGNEVSIESIITNLFANSIKAFVNSDRKERIIEVQTKFLGDSLRLSVTDSGPGIKGINLKDIWLPGETTYEDGTGLGLTIVRDTVWDLGGAVSVNASSELGGAEFIITVPILGG